jgi:hypothetical protein
LLRIAILSAEEIRNPQEAGGRSGCHYERLAGHDSYTAAYEHRVHLSPRPEVVQDSNDHEYPGEQKYQNKKSREAHAKIIANQPVDWRMEFPDGSVSIAQSRVTETTRSTCIYSFVLHAPPVALEQVEGALDAQRIALQSELSRLKSLLEQ